MFSLLFGLALIIFGFFATLFIDPFWGLVVFAAFTHITPQQLSQEYIVPLRAPFFLSIAVLICYCYAVSSKYPQKLRNWPAEFWMMLIILIGMAIGSHNAFDGEAAWDATFAFSKFVIFFLLFVNIIDSIPKLTWFHNSLILSSAWLVYKCWDLRGTTGSRFENRGGGIVEDSNMFAAALVLMLPIVVCRIFKGPVWSRIGAATGAFGMIMSIVISGSRGGFLGLAGSGMAFMIIFKEHRKRVLILLLIIGLAAAGFISEDYQERILGISEASQSDASSQSRLDAWKQAVAVFIENPIWGCGMANFGYYFGHLAENKEWGQKGHVCHSLWMEALSEGGLLVFAPLIIMLVLFFFRTTRAKRAFALKLNADVSLDISALQVGLVGFLITATFLNRLMYEPIYWWCAMAAAYSRILHEDNQRQSVSLTQNTYGSP